MTVLEKKQCIIVVDTCIILNRPNILSDLLSHKEIGKIIIPNVVISELNYQKDYGKKQSAWLAMVSIEKLLKNYPNRLSIYRKKDISGINDEKIISVAKQIKKCHSNVMTYLLTDDIYFSLAAPIAPNLEVISSKNFYAKFFAPNLNFNKQASFRFFAAVKQNNIDEIKNLFHENINPNIIDPKTGYTPLIQSVRNKSKSIIEFLMQIPSIDLNLCDNAKYRLPAISHAVQSGRLDIIEMLVKNGADIDCQSQGKNLGNTPLMISAWHGKTDYVQYFCNQGASLNQQDSNGFTALIKSCIKNHANCAKILYPISDLKIRSFEGLTAKDYAYKTKNLELINIFKENYND